MRGLNVVLLENKQTHNKNVSISSPSLPLFILLLSLSPFLVTDIHLILLYQSIPFMLSCLLLPWQLSATPPQDNPMSVIISLKLCKQYNDISDIIGVSFTHALIHVAQPIAIARTFKNKL